MSDVQDATPVTEQGVAAPVTDAGQAAFYEFVKPDGSKESYSTKEELDKAYRDSFLRQSDYTRKTQTVAQMQKAIKDREAKLEKMQEELERKSKEFQDYDRLVSSRPDLYKYLQTQLTRPASPDVAYERAQKYSDEKYETLQKDLEEIKSQMLEQQLAKQRDGLYESLSKEYPDFDRAKADEILEQLGSGDLATIVRVAHHAARGMASPAKVEEKLARAAKEKEAGKLLPSGGSPPSASPPKGKNLNELAEIAHRELGY
jgi:vacuolar-type H+-ATPase subunit I/STV1